MFKTLFKPRERSDPSKSNGLKSYAVTIRHNPKYKKGTKIPYTTGEKKEIYEAVLSFLCNEYNAVILSLAFELKGGLHLHATIGFKKVPLFKGIKYEDCHFKFVKVYNPDGWASYCNKEPILKAIMQQRETERYYLGSSTPLFLAPLGGFGGIYRTPVST
jgi:hypothetical protein